VALEDLQATGMDVADCGLFIDEKYPFLGATPDGLLGEDGLVEIKCPSAAQNLTPEEAIILNKGNCWNFWTRNKDQQITGVNKNHDYFYQIQGQLHITKRSYCKFVVWTPKGMKIETIKRDDSFWADKMEDKLVRFYNDCILPEIVDPRRSRNMPIRNPPYIEEAIRIRTQSAKKPKILKQV